MKKQVWIVVVLAIIIVILIVVLLWPVNKVKNNIQNNTTTAQQNQVTQQQKVEGIQIDSPQAAQGVSSPLKITGSVNGGGWSGFEGQVGTLQLLDGKGNKLADGVLKATTDWTKTPTQFESDITFQSKYKGPATFFSATRTPVGRQQTTKNLACLL